MQCHECQADIRPGQAFCGSCGAPLPRLCPSCSAPSEPGANFCGRCGTSLRAAAAGPPAAAPRGHTPPHLAERILSGRRALEGERKLVTVLFADLKGSMEILANRDPEEARRVLDPVLERMMDAVHQYEGTVNQVMGDGIMALFGAPVAREDHAVRAGYAALTMQKSIAEFARQHGPVDGVEVADPRGAQLRRGGRARHRQRPHDGLQRHRPDHPSGRAAWSSSPRPGRSSSPRPSPASPRGGCISSRWGSCPIKGLSEPLEALELVDAEPTRGRFQAVAGRGFTRFVGRDAELSAIRRAARAGARRPRAGRRRHRRAGRGEVAALLRARRLARQARVAHRSRRAPSRSPRSTRSCRSATSS